MLPSTRRVCDESSSLFSVGRTTTSSPKCTKPLRTLLQNVSSERTRSERVNSCVVLLFLPFPIRDPPASTVTCNLRSCKVDPRMYTSKAQACDTCHAIAMVSSADDECYNLVCHCTCAQRIQTHANKRRWVNGLHTMRHMHIST